MRVVVDTNVFVSFVIKPTEEFAELIEYLDTHATVLYSAETLTELVDVLHRRKFAKYTSPAEILEFIDWFRLAGELVEVAEEVQACRDPKDDKFLALAAAGRADCIVAGDRDLRDMGAFRGIPIFTPADFLRRCRV